MTTPKLILPPSLYSYLFFPLFPFFPEYLLAALVRNVAPCGSAAAVEVVVVVAAGLLLLAEGLLGLLLNPILVLLFAILFPLLCCLRTHCDLHFTKFKLKISTFPNISFLSPPYFPRFGLKHIIAFFSKKKYFLRLFIFLFFFEFCIMISKMLLKGNPPPQLRF